MRDTESIFEEYRPLLFAIAYRMLGTVMDAEDAVQEAYLRFRNVRIDEIESPKAYLTTIITRICIDQLKQARVQREQYFGPWLPEPVPTDHVAGDDLPALRAALLESISVAFLRLLERLSPLERAVFLLREVFDYPYGEIASIVGRSEAACWQAFHRAQQHLAAERARFRPSSEKHAALIGRFLHATVDGDLDSLTALLAEEVTLTSDGGGRAAAATRPLVGRDLVLRFWLGLYRRGRDKARVAVHHLNGAPAVLLISLTGVLEAAMLFDVDAEGSTIRAINIVRNPDKLRRLQESLTT